jgi:hypothetical protein
MLTSEPIHPELIENASEFLKWRLAYKGGREFIDEYLETFSARETATEFVVRKRISYCPRFAGAGIDDVKNSIYQRVVDVTRVGGTKSYQTATQGYSGGVDLNGNSMNSFIGCNVLPDLLVMGQVGIYVDMPPVTSPVMLNQPRPYLYTYRRENIRNWVKDPNDPYRYQSVLLRDYVYEYDDSGFPTDTVERFRHLWLDEGIVHADIYDNDLNLISSAILNLKEIPFICVELTSSLMENIADYQISLLNLASSDIYYALKSNFPFYTEQFDPISVGSPYLKPEGEAATREVVVGTATGRAYPINTDRPQFIAPPSEPLEASMNKQEQLKEEIRLLLNLTIANLRPQRASADSKKVDDQSLEAGLSYIGMTLETAERAIANTWNQYENVDEPVTIKYPQEYSLKTDSERREEAKELDDLRLKIPSTTYQKEVSKIIAKILLSHKINYTALEAIENEIENAPCVTGDPDSIRQDVEAGILDIELASNLRLYPPGTAAKAKADHAERLARIAASQSDISGARGTDTDQRSGKEEKLLSRKTDSEPTTTDRTRGEGDANINSQ